VLHAHDYVDPSEPVDMHGKRVVGVGMGNSAMDILIVHLTHSRPPPPWLGRLVAGRGIVSCPGVAVDGGGTEKGTEIAD
jgi:hypothetical protein